MRLMTKLLTYTLITAMAFLMASCQSPSQSSSSSQEEQPPSTAAESSVAPSGEQEEESTPEQQASNEPTSSEPTGSEPEGDEGMPNEPSYEDQSEATGMPAGGAGEEVMSDEEAISILDGQLEESIAVFDNMIINERAAAQATGSDLPEDEEPWGGDEPLFEEADIAENSDGQDQSSPPTAGDDEGEGNATASTARGAGDGTVVSRNGVRGNTANNQAPENVSDGSDDDIVARQIREAALKEKDPVLREKLWEEYRKYKRGQ